MDISLPTMQNTTDRRPLGEYATGTCITDVQWPNHRTWSAIFFDEHWRVIGGEMERIFNMVRAALVANPKVKNKDLMARAREIDPAAMNGMTGPQFHAKFRLAVSRERAKRNGTTKPRTRKPKMPLAEAKSTRSRKAGNLDHVRSTLIEFAVAVQAAESRSDLVKVIAGVDSWAERIVSKPKDTNV